jgi:hypothetical protein
MEYSRLKITSYMCFEESLLAVANVVEIFWFFDNK